MIAEQLKKAILQAAIQGKLTEQLPEDGDARILLKEIQNKKARLVEEGKIKKEKLLPVVTEEEISFDIPDNWCWVRLGELTSLITDGTHKTPTYIEKGIPFLSVQNISSGKFDFTKLKYISEKEHQLLVKRCKPEHGDILFCRIGTLGKPIINTIEFEYSIFVSLALIKLIIQEVNSYLVYFLSSPNMDHWVEVNKVGGGTHTNKINLRDFYMIPIPLAPLSEQNRIVEILKVALSEIDLLKIDETKLDTLQKSFPKKMKDAILQHAIQGKLTEQLPEDGNARDLLKEIQKEKNRLVEEGKIKKEKPLPEISEDEIPFDIPENWCWVRLGEVTDYGIGKQVNPQNILTNSWILELEDIEKESFKLLSRRKNRIPGSSKNQFRPGDVLYGKLRPYLKKVIIADESGYCSTEIIPFRGYDGINSDYLKYCMVSPTIDNYVNSITHGMDMPRLGTDKAINLILPLPPISEQNRIVKRLNDLLPLCESLE